jgi:hypothetical protein
VVLGSNPRAADLGASCRHRRLEEGVDCLTALCHERDVGRRSRGLAQLALEDREVIGFLRTQTESVFLFVHHPESERAESRGIEVPTGPQVFHHEQDVIDHDGAREGHLPCPPGRVVA